MATPASEYKPEERIVALHISRSGDGKSAAAASYPRPYVQADFDDRFDGVWSALKPQGWLDPEGVYRERFYTRNGYEPFQDYLTKLEMEVIAKSFRLRTLEIASATTMVQALINSSHKAQSGKMIGKLRMSGPGDFNFEVSGMKQIMDFLQFLPCNVIVSAHVIDKYGKAPGADSYSANEIIGEKVALRDQPGEVLLSCFSNVFRFSREVIGSEMKYYVEFATDVAKNAFGIPPGRFDITNKAFYPFLQQLISEIREGKFKPENYFKAHTNTGLPF